MTDIVTAKRADLTDPGIGSYAELDRVLPDDHHPALGPRDTQRAVTEVERYIENGLCAALNLEMVQVPLIVRADAGVNDMLDRDGSRSPVAFRIENDPTCPAKGSTSLRPRLLCTDTKHRLLVSSRLRAEFGNGEVPPGH